MSCINCKNKDLKKVINLGKQVLSGVFPQKKNYLKKKFSLDIYECQKCRLLQLKNIPPLGDMYGQNYGYRTSLSPLMIKHMKNKFNNLIKKYNFPKNSKILDIASNDGTFLNMFAKLKSNSFELYGCDPSAEKFKKYYNKNINLVTDYFPSKQLILDLQKRNQKLNLISSFAMFYDVKDPNSFCKNIFKLLEKNGIWVLELSYLPLFLKKLNYDQICHEHIAYYSLTTFKKIAEKNNLKILDFSFNEINGGSIHIECCRKKSKIKPNTKKILNLLNKERLITAKDYSFFNLRIENVKKTLVNFLDKLKKSKNLVIGYGASTKGNIVLNHCGINEKLLPYIADANPFKFERFTPGTNIKIISKRDMRKLKPDYLLVLIWSFRKEVIMQEKNYLINGGKLIFHLPIFHIIDKTNYKIYLKENFDSLSYS